MSGGAYDDQTQTTASGSPSLTVSAADPSSNGTLSVKTYIDGQPTSDGASADRNCSTASCTITANGQLDLSALSPGGHFIDVRATDGAGNVDDTSWGIVVGSPAQPMYRSIGDCWKGASRTMAEPTQYNLTPAFSFMPLTELTLGCNPDPSAVATAGTDDVPATVPYVSESFGTCQPDIATAEGGCAPPLTIQFWPNCARNEHSYSVPDPTTGADELMANTDLNLGQMTASMLPQIQQAIGGSSQLIPTSAIGVLASKLSQMSAASYEGGTRVEVYAGSTTIVIFADNPVVADLAAAAASLRAASSGLPTDNLTADALGQGCGS